MTYSPQDLSWFIEKEREREREREGLLVSAPACTKPIFRTLRTISPMHI